MADAPQSPTNSPQPKIVHKLAVRTLIAVVSLGALLYGVQALRDYYKDPGRVGHANTSEAIAAVELLNDGQQVVVIQPNGDILRSPDFKPGSTERDAAWQPDGSRLYYVSDRLDQTYQVFRWRPISGGESESRTMGTRGKSNPTFAPDAKPDDSLLMTSMGGALELDPVNRKMQQVLPPRQNEIPQGTAEEEGGGGSSEFNAIYGQLGDSFGKAQYLPGGKAIVAILRRDRGDVLIVHELAAAGEKAKRPTPLAAGDKIEFSMGRDGTVVYSVQNFQWPTNDVPEQFKVNGRVTTPFENYIGIYKPGSEPQPPVVASPNADAAFGSVALSPDASRILVVVGSYDGTNFTPAGLVIMPAQANGGSAGARLLQGEVYEPSWHPSGKTRGR